MLAAVDAVTALADAGFDIAHAFDAVAAAREPGLAVLGGDQRFGLLLGNTRALWPRFREALRDPELAADRDPLDRYTERSIDRVFGQIFGPIASGSSGATHHGARIFYGHRRYDGAFLPLQRLAVATGLGALAPSHLVIHPTYGPWFALRAVVVLPGDPPPARPPIALPCQCDGPCEESCTALFQRAMQSSDWRDWMAVRERCHLRAWRYSDDQIRFHYVTARRLAGQDV